MNKKNMLREFINEINDRKMMTQFIKNIFGYENFFDYNYLFRMVDNDSELIIDIYDNVSDNRFNRYVFNFDDCLGYDLKVVYEGNVFVNYISVSDALDNCDNLLKLAYLFKIDDSNMLEYAESFLDREFVLILKDILKKPI